MISVELIFQKPKQCNAKELLKETKQTHFSLSSAILLFHKLEIH